MSEDNQAVARRVLEEAFHKGNLDVIDECVSPDFVGHDPADPEDTRGIDGTKERVQIYRGAFSDLEVSIDDIFAAGDKVCTRWTARGTHDGDLMGMPPTGKSVEVEGLSIDRIEGGQIIETWDNWDTFGMMQQLGAIPAAAPAA